MYQSCLSFVLNRHNITGLATILIPLWVVILMVWLAVSMPMFHVLASLSVDIMFFLFDDTLELFEGHKMFTFDSSD
jgi:hypothetical protein